jgi:GNAT superfamily N-acetyltransferase
MASPSLCFSPIELTGADAKDVASLYSRCAEYFLLQDGAASTLVDAQELFTDVPPEKNVCNQTVLGWKGTDGLFAIAAILRDYPHDGAWYLGFMIVDAVQRGRGVGRLIYSKVEDWVVARGATEIRLAVLEANEAGERFWRSLGFSEVRRVGPDTFKKRSHRRIELNRHLVGSHADGDAQQMPVR